VTTCRHYTLRAAALQVQGTARESERVKDAAPRAAASPRCARAPHQAVTRISSLRSAGKAAAPLAASAKQALPARGGSRLSRDSAATCGHGRVARRANTCGPPRAPPELSCRSPNTVACQRSMQTRLGDRSGARCNGHEPSSSARTTPHCLPTSPRRTTLPPHATRTRAPIRRAAHTRSSSGMTRRRSRTTSARWREASGRPADSASLASRSVPGSSGSPSSSRRCGSAGRQARWRRLRQPKWVGLADVRAARWLGSQAAAAGRRGEEQRSGGKLRVHGSPAICPRT
jgi:hypothetical protein